MTVDLDAALAAIERDKQLLELVSVIRKELHVELAELRDEVLALSNRIEAVTRAQTRAQANTGLYSVQEES